MGVARRFDVYLCALDATVGQEIRKTRPCVVVSPDEMNRQISTFIVAPLTTGSHFYPSRVRSTFGGREGSVVLDQLRTLHERRIVRRLGRLGPAEGAAVLDALQLMFSG